MLPAAQLAFPGHEVPGPAEEGRSAARQGPGSGLSVYSKELWGEMGVQEMLLGPGVLPLPWCALAGPRPAISVALQCGSGGGWVEFGIERVGAALD